MNRGIPFQPIKTDTDLLSCWYSPQGEVTCKPFAGVSYENDMAPMPLPMVTFLGLDANKKDEPKKETKALPSMKKQ